MNEIKKLTGPLQLLRSCWEYFIFLGGILGFFIDANTNDDSPNIFLFYLHFFRFEIISLSILAIVYKYIRHYSSQKSSINTEKQFSVTYGKILRLTIAVIITVALVLYFNTLSKLSKKIYLFINQDIHSSLSEYIDNRSNDFDITDDEVKADVTIFSAIRARIYYYTNTFKVAYPNKLLKRAVELYCKGDLDKSLHCFTKLHENYTAYRTILIGRYIYDITQKVALSRRHYNIYTASPITEQNFYITSLSHLAQAVTIYPLNEEYTSSFKDAFANYKQKLETLADLYELCLHNNTHKIIEFSKANNWIIHEITMTDRPLESPKEVESFISIVTSFTKNDFIENIKQRTFFNNFSKLYAQIEGGASSQCFSKDDMEIFEASRDLQSWGY